MCLKHPKIWKPAGSSRLNIFTSWKLRLINENFFRQNRSSRFFSIARFTFFLFQKRRKFWTCFVFLRPSAIETFSYFNEFFHTALSNQLALAAYGCRFSVQVHILYNFMFQLDRSFFNFFCFCTWKFKLFFYQSLSNFDDYRTIPKFD